MAHPTCPEEPVSRRDQPAPNVGTLASRPRLHERQTKGQKTFLNELCGASSRTNLMYHTPRMADGNWREAWDGLSRERRRTPHPEVTAWKQGTHGEPFVDAAMRRAVT